VLLLIATFRLSRSCQLVIFIVIIHPFHAWLPGSNLYVPAAQGKLTRASNAQISGVVTFAASAPPSPLRWILMLDVPLRITLEKVDQTDGCIR